MRLIGLNGRLHSGKDTIFELIEADAIADDKDVTVARLGFADKLKMSAALALGYRPNSVGEAVAICNSLKEGGTITIDDQIGPIIITGREYLQWYGTESHRNVFGEDFWVDALLPTNYMDLEGIHSDIEVVTDVRFANEAERILELGGEIWWINAEKRLGPLPANAHPSEQPLPRELITWELDNNGTLSALKAHVFLASHICQPRHRQYRGLQCHQ
jgi:hypothetical protein